MQVDGVDGWTNFAALPCEPETFEAGGVMEVEVQISGNHGGFFMMSICDSLDMTEECFARNQLITCASCRPSPLTHPWCTVLLMR